MCPAYLRADAGAMELHVTHQLVEDRRRGLESAARVRRLGCIARRFAATSDRS